MKFWAAALGYGAMQAPASDQPDVRKRQAACEAAAAASAAVSPNWCRSAASSRTLPWAHSSQRTGGVPYFVEQVVREAADDRDDGDAGPLAQRSARPTEAVLGIGGVAVTILDVDAAAILTEAP